MSKTELCPTCNGSTIDGDATVKKSLRSSRAVYPVPCPECHGTGRTTPTCTCVVSDNRITSTKTNMQWTNGACPIHGRTLPAAGFQPIPTYASQAVYDNLSQLTDPAQPPAAGLDEVRRTLDQPPADTGELRQKLAAIEHERWSDWQKYCHEVIRTNFKTLPLETILKRWDRQIATPYAELSEAEQASDMEQVDRYWPLIEQYVAAERRKAVEEFAELVKRNIQATSSFNPLYANPKQEHAVNDARNMALALIDHLLQTYREGKQ